MIVMRYTSLAVSRPLIRGRGLKPPPLSRAQVAQGSPSHTGAWIETHQGDYHQKPYTRRPLIRGRGLKQIENGKMYKILHVALSYGGVD